MDNKLDGYRFGTANTDQDQESNANAYFRSSISSSSSESKLMIELANSMQRPIGSWAELDRRVWNMVMAWDKCKSKLED